MVKTEFQRIVFFEADDTKIFNLDKTGCNTGPTDKMFFSKSGRAAYLAIPNCGKALYLYGFICYECSCEVLTIFSCLKRK